MILLVYYFLCYIAKSARNCGFSFFFSAYSRDAKEQFVTCIRIERIRIWKCIYITYLYLFHTLTLRFSFCNSIINFYQTHYSCKKEPPPTRKMTKTAIFRIETTAIFDRECYSSCKLWVLVYRKNKMASE